MRFASARKVFSAVLIGMLALWILLIGPFGITKFQLQNRIFTVRNIDATLLDDQLHVEMEIAACSYFPWKITVDGVRFKSMGEYGMLVDDLIADCIPFEMSFGKEYEVTVCYTFDYHLFKQEYSNVEMNDSFDYEESAYEFVQSVGLIFESDNIPTGEAMCLFWDA